MKWLMAMVGLVMLTACGADGPPVRPSLNGTIGVNSAGQVTTGAALGTRVGPLSVSLGL